MALASRASSFRPQKHWRGRPLAVSQNVQQILVAKGDPRLQVLAIFLQHSLIQDIGIKLAGFCKLDNLFSDSFPQNALVAKLKSCASHFECDGHDPLGLGIEFGTVQKRAMGMTRAAIGNGIMQIPRVILVALHWGHNSGDASAICRSGLGETIAGTSRPRTPRLPWQTIHARSDKSRSKRARKRPGWRRSVCDR